MKLGKKRARTLSLEGLDLFNIGVNAQPLTPTPPKKNKTCLRVNYYKTHEPLFQKAISYLSKETYLYISAKYSGPFEAVGSHALNLLLFLNPTMNFTKSYRYENKEGDGFSAFFEFENQGLAELIYCGPRHNLIFELDIVGRDRRIMLGKNFSNLKLYKYRPSSYQF